MRETFWAHEAFPSGKAAAPAGAPSPAASEAKRGGRPEGVPGPSTAQDTTQPKE